MLTGKEHRRGSHELYLCRAMQHLNFYSIVFGGTFSWSLRWKSEA